MKKLNSLLIVATALMSLSLRAAEIPLPPPPKDTPLVATNDIASAQRLEWWTAARFGMFIHWGLYSEWGCHYPGTNGELINGGSAHMMQRLKIPLAEYAKIADVFDPTNFNANEWVRIAKNAGMKYIIFTSKHHDGFAMFNSPSSDYNIVNRTPWHRDPVKELAEACRKQGIKFGVYYSLGRDWADPDVPTKKGYRSNTWDYPDETNKVFSRYFKRKVVPQVTELLTQYHPAVLWFDTPEEISKAESQELLALIHRLEPDCIVNSRIGRGLGDYGVQEQKVPGGGDVKPWETCMTLNHHWAYFMGDDNWKTPAVVVSNLVTIASRGGNYLLDVGPTGAGVIQPEAIGILKQVGVWLKANGVAIYGTTASPLKTQPAWGRVTEKASPDGATLYLNVFDWPKDGKLVVPGLHVAMTKAYLLKRNFFGWHRKFKTVDGPDGVTVFVPPKAPDKTCSVVVLKFKGPL
jgi:alpha-L-fucosidase